MKKTLLLLAVLICTANQLFARQLSPTEALQRATGTQISPTSTMSEMQSMPAFTAADDAMTFFYVFADGDDNGYLIVSADDIAAPILGYADNGTFDADNIPANMKAFLDEYKREMAWASTKGASAYAVAPTATRAAIAPLVTTKWNQTDPFDLLCPEDAYGKTATGCVATAMAQIMKYHEHPVRGTGSSTYEWGGEYLSADYGSTTYDWDNMLDVYTDDATEEQRNAVATLMYHCGVSVEMSYGSPAIGGSGAFSTDAAAALVNYFGYDKSVIYHHRNNFSYSQWEEMVYNHLSTMGPVYFDGQSSDGGHAFVCDGYKEGYFHINWGWGGMSDGYFRLSALDPAAQGTGGSASLDGFNYDQAGLFNLFPDKGGEASPLVACDGDFGVSSRNITKSASSYVTFKASGGFVNYSWFALSGMIPGVKLVSESGAETYIQSSSAIGSFLPGYSFKNYQILSTKFSTAGTYTVTPAYYYENQWYDIPTGIGNIGSLSVEVTSTTIKVTSSFDSGLSVTDVTLNTPIYLNKNFSIDAKVSSPTKEYLGEISVALYSATGALMTTSEPIMVNVVAGETIDLNLITMFSSTTFNKAGDYDLAFVDNHSNVISEKIPVTVKAEPAETTISVTEFGMTDGKTTDVDPNNVNITLSIECTAGYVYDKFEMYIFSYETGYSVTNQDKYIKIEEGNTTTTEFNLSFEGEAGKTYVAIPYCNEYGDASGRITTDYLFFTVKESSGIEAVGADAAEVGMYPNPADAEVNFEAQSDITAIDIFAVSGAKVLGVTDIADSKTTVDVSALPAGNYVVTIATADGIAVKRLLKR